MIAGCITVTGLASTIINVIVLMAGDMVIVGLVFTMICCLILGMGVPTTANYCIMASTCAPILIQLGIDPICAHFFVFYFGIAADITPPVALAAYAASAIAKSRPMATAVNATKLGIAKFVVPYIFAFSPVLLLLGDDVTAVAVVSNTLTALVGVFGLQCALTNTLFHHHLNPVFRIVLAAGGLGMMIPARRAISRARSSSRPCAASSSRSRAKSAPPSLCLRPMLLRRSSPRIPPGSKVGRPGDAIMMKTTITGKADDYER